MEILTGVEAAQAYAERTKRQEEVLAKHMAAGVVFELLDGVLIEPDVKIAPGAVILPGVILRGNTEIGEGCVIGPNSLNPAGGLHGGVYFTLADAVSGALCRADGRKYVTECADIRFLKGVREGAVTAAATLLRRGRRSCVIRVEITDEGGALLAVFTGNFTCVGDDYRK